MAKQPLKFMDQKIRQTLREISILSCLPAYFRRSAKRESRDLPFIAVSWRNAHIALIKRTEP